MQRGCEIEEMKLANFLRMPQQCQPFVCFAGTINCVKVTGTNHFSLKERKPMARKIMVLLLTFIFLAALTVGAGAEAKNPQVLMETSMGKIRIELFEKEAPITIKNFLDYAKSGFYNGTIFHRVIPGFMAQGGGFTPDMIQKQVKAPIKNEAGNGLKNDRGTIAMARTMIVDSATAQFFINVVNNGALNHRDNSVQGYGYAVFGRVVEGMDVVDAIVKVKTEAVKGHRDVPVTPVIIKSVTLVQ
jgi:peptidyl-prolyl cis-trans isomerase A (cyclophilin A)